MRGEYIVVSDDCHSINHILSRVLVRMCVSSSTYYLCCLPVHSVVCIELTYIQDANKIRVLFCKSYLCMQVEQKATFNVWLSFRKITRMSTVTVFWPFCWHVYCVRYNCSSMDLEHKGWLLFKRSETENWKYKIKGITQNTTAASVEPFSYETKQHD